MDIQQTEQDAQQPGYGSTVGDGQQIDRNPPDPSMERMALVKDWQKKIEDAKTFHEPTFKIMRANAKFAAGKQTEYEGMYQANITLKLLNDRCAALYAKNPKVRAQRKQKLWYQQWDGTPQMLQQAQMAVMQHAMSMAKEMAPELAGTIDMGAGAMTGMPPGMPQLPPGISLPGMPPPMAPEIAMQVMQEAQAGEQQKRLYERMGKTLELVAQYSMDEQVPGFKEQAKQMVLRALTCKVGYVKLGYQRIMEQTPDIDAKISDATDQLAQLEMLAQDLADGEIEQHSAKAEELRVNLEALQAQKEIVLREGLVFSFPASWSILVDPACVQLKGFVGADWVAQEYLFTPDQVQKLYKIDVGNTYKAHTPDGEQGDKRRNSDKLCAVYEVYDLVNRQCFTIIAGYTDFVKMPAAPDVTLEQFHPIYTLAFNHTEDPECIYGPSDVELMMPMAREYNRQREAIRQHRIANRPAYVCGKGVFDSDGDDSTLMKFATHADHEIIETNLTKTEDINKVLQAKPTVPIDPALYDVEQVFNDVSRVTGRQASDFGQQMASETATGQSISAQGMATTQRSNIEDLDMMLTDLMRGAGQVLLLEMGEDMVKRIAGPGAVWPQLSRQEVCEEMFLTIQAGSSGLPNKMGRIAAIEKVMPFLMQVGGISQRKLGEFMLRELDENIEIDEFLEDGALSTVALNAAAKPNMAPGPGGMAQAAMGAANAPAPGQSGAKAQNMMPAPAQHA